MDPNSVLFAWPSLVLGLFVYVVVFLLRRTLEKVWPGIGQNTWWTDIALPTLPVVLGMLVAGLVHGDPLPGSMTSLGWRLIYGAGIGFLSAWIYRVLKAMLKRAVGTDTPPASGVLP